MVNATEVGGESRGQGDKTSTMIKKEGIYNASNCLPRLSKCSEMMLVMDNDTNLL